VTDPIVCRLNHRLQRGQTCEQCGERRPTREETQDYLTAMFRRLNEAGCEYIPVPPRD
jgi:hypothetical protein